LKRLSPLKMLTSLYLKRLLELFLAPSLEE
jgi:hypothetical protein